DSNLALTGDRRIATVGFKRLDSNFLLLDRDPGGPCFGDSGGPILMLSGRVQYVVAANRSVRTDDSNVKQDCTGELGGQRLDLSSVVDFINANVASHGP